MVQRLHMPLEIAFYVCWIWAFIALKVFCTITMQSFNVGPQWTFCCKWTWALWASFYLGRQVETSNVHFKDWFCCSIIWANFTCKASDLIMHRHNMSLEIPFSWCCVCTEGTFKVFELVMHMTWLLIWPCVEALKEHKSQLESFTFWCTLLIWFLRLQLWRAEKSQSLQLKFFIFSCTPFMWCFRFPLYFEVKGHCEHWKSSFTALAMFKNLNSCTLCSGQQLGNKCLHMLQVAADINKVSFKKPLMKFNLNNLPNLFQWFQFKVPSYYFVQSKYTYSPFLYFCYNNELLIEIRFNIA